MKSPRRAAAGAASWGLILYSLAQYHVRIADAQPSNDFHGDYRYNHDLPEDFHCPTTITATATTINTRNNNHDQHYNTQNYGYDYEWEGWDYYRLLELEPPIDIITPSSSSSSSSSMTSSHDTKVIRKAYRKQAQKWHPDKHTATSASSTSTTSTNSNSTSSSRQFSATANSKGQQQQQQQHRATKDTSTTTTPTTSLEEATARFARIAQAYEVLSDDWKRKEYDLFLQYCQQLTSTSSSSSSFPTGNHETRTSRWSNLFSNFGDPLRVFEDFLFGSLLLDDDDDDLRNEDSWFFDMPPPTKDFNPTNAQPIRITKHQDLIRNALEEDMVRMSQTEEYAPESSDGRYFYRIISQDFYQYLDPYTGRIALQPITQPYLREEGYRHPNQHNQNNNYYYAEQEQRQSNTHTKSTRSKSSSMPRESLLFPGEILTPNSALLMSPNRRYYAGLSADCELLIMANNAFGEDVVVWSSESLLPSQYRSTSDACFVTLRGPHLVLALGRPELPKRILWYSEASDDDESGDSDTLHRHHHHNSNNDRIFSDPAAPHAPSTYLAQLDNDGSLVVYKVWALPMEQSTLPLSIRAWLATRNLWMGTTRDHHYDHLFDPQLHRHHQQQQRRRRRHSQQSSSFTSTSSSTAITTYKRCIYSTGPLGCFRLARRLYQLSMDIYYSIQSLLGKLDATFDVWMDLILEEDDYVRVLKESTQGVGSHILTSSARLVRRILHLILLKSHGNSS